MLRRRCGNLLKNLAERSLSRRSLLGNTASIHGDAPKSSVFSLLAGKFKPINPAKDVLIHEWGKRLPFSTGARVLLSKPPAASTLRSPQKQISTWLYICSGWVFGMVVLGGMTRLTRSGLSMTDWKFTGSLPPMSAEEWEAEFDKYKQSPEYRTVNKGMSLEDFKFIYWMEYAHRMSGRGLGVAFTLPFLYFLVRGQLTPSLLTKLGVLLGLGAGQGLIGWWMVKSGLEEPAQEFMPARVSPYRLATHLVSAFAIYSGLLWTAMSVASPGPLSQHLPCDVLRASGKVRRMVLPVAGVVGLTALSGAFVAGNDAGRAYNTFPKMGDDWIPDGLLDLQPTIRNFFENTATVQLDHRILATTTLLSVAGLFWASRGLPLQPRTNKLLTGAVHMTLLQVGLGIYALLTYVPVPVGVAHQAGALTLFTIVLALAHSVRRPSMAPTETTRLLNRLKMGRASA